MKNLVRNMSYYLFWIKKLLLATLLLSLIGNLWLLLTKPNTLPVVTVRIEGHLQYTDHKVLQALISKNAMGGMLSINLEAIRHAVKSLPWIKNVQVLKKWPDTLLIQVQEYQPVAWWQDKLVDKEGDLFKVPVSTKKENRKQKTEKGERKIENLENLELPHFMGPPGWVGEILKFYFELAPLLQKKGLYIHELGLNARLAWYMILTNGMTLKLGRGFSKTKLLRFLKVYNDLIQQQSKLSHHKKRLLIDLRYTNGLAVQTVPIE
jgi:cell division protein FtsQ